MNVVIPIVKTMIEYIEPTRTTKVVVDYIDIEEEPSFRLSDPVLHNYPYTHKGNAEFHETSEGYCIEVYPKEHKFMQEPEQVISVFLSPVLEANGKYFKLEEVHSVHREDEEY